MKNPTRFWRTGAVAVVLAALGSAGFADDANAAEEGAMQCLSSPYDVDETVHRIELSARHRGIAVFGCFEQAGAGAGIARSHAVSNRVRVVVLESAQGGTPVLMTAQHASARDDSVFDLPLSIRVRPGSDGRSEVWLEAPQVGPGIQQELERDLVALDEVVRDALRA